MPIVSTYEKSLCLRRNSKSTRFSATDRGFQPWSMSMSSRHGSPSKSTCLILRAPPRSSPWGNRTLGRSWSLFCGACLVKVRVSIRERSSFQRRTSSSSGQANVSLPTILWGHLESGKIRQTQVFGLGIALAGSFSCQQNWSWQHGTFVLTSSGPHS